METRVPGTDSCDRPKRSNETFCYGNDFGEKTNRKIPDRGKVTKGTFDFVRRQSGQKGKKN